MSHKIVDVFELQQTFERNLLGTIFFKKWLNKKYRMFVLDIYNYLSNKIIP